MPGHRKRHLSAYLVLLRGVNVGGKNPVSMVQLRTLLEDLGFSGVATYIASGNVVLQSDRPAGEIRAQIEGALPRTFRLHSDLIAALVLTHAQLRAVVDRKPEGFGEHPETFHSDVIFLIDIDAETAMQAFDPRPGVDTVWAGDGVVYSQRLSAQRTKSRLNKAMSSPAYRSMTIRNWATTVALLELLERSARS